MSNETAIQANVVLATTEKAARARYSEAFIARCRANRSPDAMSVYLLTALVNTNFAHRDVDKAMGLPDGTVQEYLKTGKPVMEADNQTKRDVDSRILFGDDEAEAVFSVLAKLKLKGAFGSKGLTNAGVLAAML